MITIDALVYAKAHGGWSLEKEARGQTKVRYEHKRFRFDFYTCSDFASEDVVRGAAKGQAAENERSEDLQILRPFVFGGLALGGATYDVFAGEVRTGVEVETKSLVFVTDFGLPSGFFLQRPTAMCFCVDESINRYHPISGSTNHEDFLNFRVIWHS